VIVGRDKPRPSEAMPASLSCGATVFGMNCSIPAGIHIGKNCIIHPGVSNQMLQHAVASGATVSPETA